MSALAPREASAPVPKGIPLGLGMAVSGLIAILTGIAWLSESPTVALHFLGLSAAQLTSICVLTAGGAWVLSRQRMQRGQPPIHRRNAVSLGLLSMLIWLVYGISSNT